MLTVGRRGWWLSGWTKSWAFCMCSHVVASVIDGRHWWLSPCHPLSVFVLCGTACNTTCWKERLLERLGVRHTLKFSVFIECISSVISANHIFFFLFILFLIFDVLSLLLQLFVIDYTGWIYAEKGSAESEGGLKGWKGR